MNANDIQAEHDRLCLSLGWRFMMAPACNLQRSTVAIVGLKAPGGREVPHGPAWSQELGSAYVVKSWRGQPAGRRPLQQLNPSGACVKYFGSTPAPPFTAQYVPFRSASWQRIAAQVFVMKRWSSRADFGAGRSHNRTPSYSCVSANKSSLPKSQPCSARRTGGGCSRWVGRPDNFSLSNSATDGVCSAFPILVISSCLRRAVSEGCFRDAPWMKRSNIYLAVALDHLLTTNDPAFTHPDALIGGLVSLRDVDRLVPLIPKRDFMHVQRRSNAIPDGISRKSWGVDVHARTPRACEIPPRDVL